MADFRVLAWNAWQNDKLGVEVRIWDGNNLSSAYLVGDVKAGYSEQLVLQFPKGAPLPLQAFFTWSENVGGMIVTRASVVDTNPDQKKNNAVQIKWGNLGSDYPSLNSPISYEYVDSLFVYWEGLKGEPRNASRSFPSSVQAAGAGPRTPGQGKDFTWNTWTLTQTNGQPFATFSNMTGHLQDFPGYMVLTLNYDYVAQGWEDNYTSFYIEFIDEAGVVLLTLNVQGGITFAPVEFQTRCDSIHVSTTSSNIADYFAQTARITIGHRGGPLIKC